MTYEKYKDRYLHPCIDCGRMVAPRAKRCRSCMMKHLWAEGIYDRKKEWMKGPTHPRWKGGRSPHGKGYILIYMPEHPRAYNNRVLEHIVVWEKANNRPLPKGYIIHHINGIRDDNRPINLVALLPSQHPTTTLMDIKNKRIQELEALLKKHNINPNGVY